MSDDVLVSCWDLGCFYVLQLVIGKYLTWFFCHSIKLNVVVIPYLEFSWWLRVKDTPWDSFLSVSLLKFSFSWMAFCWEDFFSLFLTVLLEAVENNLLWSGDRWHNDRVVCFLCMFHEVGSYWVALRCFIEKHFLILHFCNFLQAIWVLRLWPQTSKNLQRIPS